MSKLRSIPRQEAEQGLIFAGLVVFHCPNKVESAPSIKALKVGSPLLFHGENIHLRFGVGV